METGTARISAREKIGYGLGDAASQVVFSSVMLFMAYFYTDIFGISAAAMGTLFLAVRVIDAITDPIMGAIADRTSTRRGKFRPYVIWLSIPFALSAVIAFTTPQFGYTGKLIYAYGTYSLLMVIYTAINIPYCALGGVLTADPQERVSLNSYRFFLGTGGGVLVAATTMKLAEWLGQGDQQKGFQLAIAVLGAGAIILFAITYFSTRERVEQVATTKTNLREDLRLLFANDQWRIVALMNFVLLIALVIRSSSAIYYMKWYAGRADLTSTFLTVGMAAAMFGTLFATSLCKRFTKVNSYILTQSIVVMLSIGLFFLPNDKIVLIVIGFAGVHFFNQMAIPILWAMMADTVDYGEWQSGRRITGLVFSGVLFALKLGMAVGGALLGWLLAHYGYAAEAISQSPRTIHGIVLLFTLIPVFGHLGLIVLVSRYNLEADRCRMIREELDKRREVGQVPFFTSSILPLGTRMR
ncbi:MAG TPA: glycoside-pentoside-hexuronide (GPH):cation symporter [bacterium]|nr:glycoside-pentoside-hexuronide (GPH):cation symporter [bacterium]